MTRCLDEGRAVHVINLNFRQAFNVFPTMFLYPSWDVMVWMGGSNQGIKLWLHEHTQGIVADGLFPTSRLLTSRTSQGSVLQPP